jgi:hypothetical protein
MNKTFDFMGFKMIEREPSLGIDADCVMLFSGNHETARDHVNRIHRETFYECMASLGKPTPEDGV